MLRSGFAVEVWACGSSRARCWQHEASGTKAQARGCWRRALGRSHGRVAAEPHARAHDEDAMACDGA
jgi:hypothetical protein